jgi:hypothetical protein
LTKIFEYSIIHTIKSIFHVIKRRKMRTLNPVEVNPNELKSDDILGFKVVAVIGYAHDWAAYRGLTDWDDEEVASQGDKLSKEAAEALFYAPVALGLKYRGY